MPILKNDKYDSRSTHPRIEKLNNVNAHNRLNSGQTSPVIFRPFKSCLSAQIRFMLFKGPGSFNQILLIGKMRVFKSLSIDTTQNSVPQAILQYLLLHLFL
jgi:hypothetical protein